MKDIVIVVCDDLEKDVDIACDVLYNNLQLSADNVHCPRNSEQLWEILENHPTDILLLDVCLGRENGFLIGVDVLKKYPKIVILYYSSSCSSTSRMVATVSGGVGWIDKHSEDFVQEFTRLVTQWSDIVYRKRELERRLQNVRRRV